MSENIPPQSGGVSPAPSSPPKRAKPSRARRLLRGLIAPVLILLAALAAWMYLPAIREFAGGTPTPTMLPPTFTPQAAIPTETYTPQPTSLPTATAYPASGFVKDPAVLDPKLPGQSPMIVVLNDDTNLTADPPFDQLGWYDSDTIAQQIGRVINEPFHATTGPASVVWKMDVPLQPGLYEIYILDTVYSSAGELDFRVMSGDRELTPLLGSQHIEFRSQSGIPSQLMDEWAYLGLYDLDGADLLSVLSAWEARDMNTIVAVDRVLIARQPDSLRAYLASLPANMPKYVIDDTAAVIDTDATIYTRNDLPAWGDACQMVINPEYNSLITWNIAGQVPVGDYDVWVWISEIKGEADLEYRLLINEEESINTLIANTQNIPSNQWVSLGTWNVSYGEGINASRFVKLALQMEIPRGSAGEIPIDAAAFIKR